MAKDALSFYDVKTKKKFETNDFEVREKTAVSTLLLSLKRAVTNAGEFYLKKMLNV